MSLVPFGSEFERNLLLTRSGSFLYLKQDFYIKKKFSKTFKPSRNFNFNGALPTGWRLCTSRTASGSTWLRLSTSHSSSSSSPTVGSMSSWNSLMWINVTFLQKNNIDETFSYHTASKCVTGYCNMKKRRQSLECTWGRIII